MMNILLRLTLFAYGNLILRILVVESRTTDQNIIRVYFNG